MGQKEVLISIRQSMGAGKKHFENIAAAQGNSMVWAKESGFAMQVIEKSTALQACPLDSIRKAIINVASIGLSLNPAEKLAYIIPRKGVACLDISYRGLVKIATDSGSIIWAKAMIVRETDDFKFKGVDEKPQHTFNAFSTEKDRGKIVGGYSIAKLHNGDYLVDTMTIAEIDEIKNTSSAKNGPWKNWPEEMMKKTLLRRGSKSWPITDRFMAAEAAINEHQGLTSLATGDIQSQEAIILVNNDELKILNGLIKDSHVNIKKIYEAFGVESIEQLPQNEFSACKARLQQALKAHEKKGKKNADTPAEG